MSITDFFISNATYFGVLSIIGGIFLVTANSLSADWDDKTLMEQLVPLAYGLFGAAVCFVLPGLIAEYNLSSLAVGSTIIAILIAISSTAQILIAMVLVLRYYQKKRIKQ